jgi:hypothetical protein
MCDRIAGQMGRHLTVWQTELLTLVNYKHLRQPGHQGRKNQSPSRADRATTEAGSGTRSIMAALHPAKLAAFLSRLT